jgi:hypothetical protein
MEATGSSETTVDFRQNKWNNIPEDRTVNNRGNLTYKIRAF